MNDMKHAVKTLIVCAAMAFAGQVPANAQLGNLLKKAKQAIENVTGKPEAEGQAGQAAASVAIPSGGTMQNPFSDAADIELVGAYGKSTSANYGTVYLVLKVTMKANESRILFGGEIDGAKTMAVDQDGNAYVTTAFGQYPKDVVEGVAVKVALDGKEEQFPDVKKTAKTLRQIRLGCHINAQNRGMITFKDVPVQWDVQPQ